MKIRMNKLVAALLATALVFGAVSVMASAANANPYVKISSISNVALESKAQTVTVSLSPDTELKNASIVLSYDKTALADVSVVNADNKVDKDIKISSGAENGKITLNADSAANTDKANDMTLFTIKFDFAKGTKGLVELTAAVAPIVTEDDAKATIGEKEFGASLVVGEEKAEDVYNNFAGIGLKGFIKSAGKDAPIADIDVNVTLLPCEGEDAIKPVAPFTLEKDDVMCTKPVLKDADIKAFLTKNEDAITAKIQAVAGNEKISCDDFDVEKAVISLEPADAKTYEEGKTYVYSVTLKQLKKTTATIEVIFRPAFDDTTLYHSSDIDPITMVMEVNAGKTVKSQAEILTYVKTYAPTIDQHIKNSDDRYDINDFVLDESVVEFNGAKMTGKETFVEGGNNVYKVYFDQVNVPATVLGAAAQAFGKIDYSQFAKAQVFAINETIDAFKAMVDSLVNAEWPTADDVKEEEKDDSKSPSTGSAVSLGFALASVVALASAAVVAVKRKED